YIRKYAFVLCCSVTSNGVYYHSVLVQFSNGSVKNTDNLQFAMFKNMDERNPRKKVRRMLVAESDRLSMWAITLEYYVGVLNKQTMQMEVHNAQLFNLQPVIPGNGNMLYRPNCVTFTFCIKFLLTDYF
uniref:Uncharacterized protein n=1 Tax=Neogobius melanostomus TaxID=47308 RepID=A0A8C6UN51_9GOBI